MVGRAQGRAPGGRGLRLPGPPQGRAGRAAQRRRRGRLQPQPQHQRVATTPTSAPPTTYADRVDTVNQAKDAGLSPCSGLIVGHGRERRGAVDAVFALRELETDSIPVNFLMPFEGTPLEDTWQLTPARCLRILALVRFACPDTELRIAGGREMHLRSLQPLALHVANSLFLGDYLTSEGQAAKADLEMIRRRRLHRPGARRPGDFCGRGRRRRTVTDFHPAPRRGDGACPQCLRQCCPALRCLRATAACSGTRTPRWTGRRPMRLTAADGVRLQLEAADGGALRGGGCHELLVVHHPRLPAPRP